MMFSDSGGTGDLPHSISFTYCDAGMISFKVLYIRGVECGPE